MANEISVALSAPEAAQLVTRYPRAGVHPRAGVQANYPRAGVFHANAFASRIAGLRSAFPRLSPFGLASSQ
jgi:hypothetical protein